MIKQLNWIVIHVVMSMQLLENAICIQHVSATEYLN